MKTTNKEFNLSEKISVMEAIGQYEHEILFIEDVKEFIRLLKDGAKCVNCGRGWGEHNNFPKNTISCCPDCDHKIDFTDLDKLVGEKLIC